MKIHQRLAILTLVGGGGKGGGAKRSSLLENYLKMIRNISGHCV